MIQIRPAKTLSGGESFLASLSLALGLADVVATETGGALLDTLFVDEGFGMLDADALDQVMDTLDELRAGGRVVGVVSHVEELRQRIPVRLRVRKARTGSTLEWDSRTGNHIFDMAFSNPNYPNAPTDLSHIGGHYEADGGSDYV